MNTIPFIGTDNEWETFPSKKALFKVLNDKDEVERVYNIVVEQGEY